MGQVPRLSELYLEVVVRLLQAGDVLGDWETHVRGFGISGERMSGTTHLKKGLRKGQWAAKVTDRTENLSLPCAQVLVRGYQASAPMASRDRLPSSNSFRGNHQTQG